MSQDPLEYENIHENNEWSLHSIIHFVKNNIIQILMLLLVVIIVIIVDYISQINMVIYGLPSAIPGLSNTSSSNNNNNNNNDKPMLKTHLPTKIPFRKHKKSHRKH